MRIKLRPDCLEAVRVWQAFLKQNDAEVIKTLNAENVSLEAVFLDKIGSDYYLIYVMACDDFQKAHDVAKINDSFVDKFHRQFKQEW